MIRVLANHPCRSFALVAVVAAALAACEPETVGGAGPASSAARSDTGQARMSTQAAPTTASPTLSGMAEVNEPPARAPSTRGGAGGGGDGDGKAEPQGKQSHAGAGGTSTAGGNNKGGTFASPAGGSSGMGGAASTTAAKKPECTQLSSCCGSLEDQDDKNDCEELVQRDDADRCARRSEDFCQANAAGAGAGGATAMSPSMTGAGAGAQGDACTQLSTCCSTLDGLQARTCKQTVEEARANDCTRLLERRCPELGPVPQEPACATLHTCCGKLTEPRAREQCRRALDDGDRRDCERASMALCQ